MATVESIEKLNEAEEIGRMATVESIEKNNEAEGLGRMATVESIEKLNDAEGLDIVPCPTPTTSEKPEPHVGMVFSSIQEAELVYQDYGRENGFVIRRRSTYKAQRGRRITRVLFTCSCEGVHKKKCSLNDDGKTKRIRSTMRTNCKAMMRIIWDRETDEWVVNDFTDDHNHVMVTPAKRVLMGSNKHVPHSIMTRWMRDANKDEGIATDSLTHDRLVGSEAMRISHLCRRSTQLAYLAGRSEEAYKVAMDFLDQAFEKVKQLDNIVVERENADKSSNETCKSLNDEVLSVQPIETCKSLNDEVLSVQPISQTKDRKRARKTKETSLDIVSGKRKSKSGIEISEANKKPRICKTCSGHGHDSRNCKEKDKNKGVDSIDDGVDRNVDGVDSNAKGVDSTANGVDSNEKRVDNNDKAVDSNAKRVDRNDNGVDSNDKLVDRNDNGVDSNDKGVVGNDNGVDSNDKRVDTNAKGDVGNAEGVESNAKGVDSNDKGVDRNDNGVDSIDKRVDTNAKGDVGNAEGVKSNAKGVDMNDIVVNMNEKEVDSNVAELPKTGVEGI